MFLSPCSFLLSFCVQTGQGRRRERVTPRGATILLKGEGVREDPALGWDRRRKKKKSRTLLTTNTGKGEGGKEGSSKSKGEREEDPCFSEIDPGRPRKKERREGEEGGRAVRGNGPLNDPPRVSTDRLC